MPSFWDDPLIDQYWFDFPRAAVPAVSTAGTPYSRSVWCGMPKIPPQVIESVFYLYTSKEDAISGAPFGGSGFFVGIKADGIDDYTYAYAVTNWHVAVSGGASVIRVNKKGGGCDIYETDPSEWTFKPGGYDIAVCSVPLARETHEVTVLSVNMLTTQNEVAHLKIGPGEDVFMAGRFVDHDGAETNVPAVRFGNISVMPQRIRQPTGSDAPSFILDVHSRTGYSGSPVFVYRTVGSDLTEGPLVLSSQVQFLRLLGIHWGQFPEKWEIGRDEAKPKAQMDANGVTVSGDATYIKGLSGMTMAAPAWAIRELLDMPSLKKVRDAETAMVRERRAASGKLPPIAEKAEPTAPESDNPSHVC